MSQQTTAQQFPKIKIPGSASSPGITKAQVNLPGNHKNIKDLEEQHISLFALLAAASLASLRAVSVPYWYYRQPPFNQINDPVQAADVAPWEIKNFVYSGAS